MLAVPLVAKNSKNPQLVIDGLKFVVVTVLVTAESIILALIADFKSIIPSHKILGRQASCMGFFCQHRCEIFPQSLKACHLSGQFCTARASGISERRRGGHRHILIYVTIAGVIAQRVVTGIWHHEPGRSATIRGDLYSHRIIGSIE